MLGRRRWQVSGAGARGRLSAMGSAAQHFAEAGGIVVGQPAAS
jgi:hypothetical protein